MYPNLLSSVIFAGAENLINNLIRLDPQGLARLVPLHNSLIHIESTAPALSLYILIHENGVHLSGRHEGEVDTGIRGPASALLSLLGSANRPVNFYGKGIEVSGSLETAQQFQQLLGQLNIDWEFQLSRFLGDIPTQAVSDSLKQGQESISKGFDSILQDVDEYLHEEKRLLPGRPELESFYSSVHDLRLATDRLSARLDALSGKLAKPPAPATEARPNE